MAQDEEPWRATVAANLLEAQRKTPRLGTRRSRSGCITCKQRRVKCGEERPGCQRCYIAGVKCKGYANSKQQAKNLVLSGLNDNPSLGLRLAEGERRAFDFFLSCAGPRLAGTLDKEFWCGYVLQLAHRESFVTDCLLSISTLYEHPQFMASFRQNPYQASLEERNDLSQLDVIHPNVPPPPGRFLSGALGLYNRAIRNLRERIESGSATPQLALVSCALFVCIEIIRDNVFAAFALINQGLSLLDQYESNKTQQDESGPFGMVKLMFSRMGVSSATIGHRLPTDEAPTSMTTRHVSAFQSIADARDGLFAIMSDSYDFFAHATAWREAVMTSKTQDPCKDHKSTDFETTAMIETMYGVRYKWTHEEEIPPAQVQNSVPSAVVNWESMRDDDMLDEKPCVERIDSPFKQDSSPRSIDQIEAEVAESLEKLQQRQLHLLDALRHWLQAFQNTHKSAGVGPEATSHLLMYYHATIAWLSTRLALTEVAFDELTSHFDQILHHAEVYLDAPTIAKAIFTFETGAIAPLFMTATRCRIPSLRRKALDLMARAPRKECFHGAQSTAELACRAVELEEEGLGHRRPDTSGTCAATPVDDNVLPPEGRRIHDLGLMKNRESQRHEMSITRYATIDGQYKRSTEVVTI